MYVYRILHGRADIRNFSLSVEKIFLEWAQRTKYHSELVSNLTKAPLQDGMDTRMGTQELLIMMLLTLKRS